MNVTTSKTSAPNLCDGHIILHKSAYIVYMYIMLPVCIVYTFCFCIQSPIFALKLLCMHAKGSPESSLDFATK